MKLAKERGVTKFLAFLNSPPVYYTQNGLATNTGRGGTANLKPDCYEKYARFLADVVEGVERQDGIKFDYICPFNEPDGHWNWVGPKQEGSPATNREVARTVRLLSKEFVNRKMDTQIMVNESRIIVVCSVPIKRIGSVAIRFSLSFVRIVWILIWGIYPMFPD